MTAEKSSQSDPSDISGTEPGPPVISPSLALPSLVKRALVPSIPANPPSSSSASIPRREGKGQGEEDEEAQKQNTGGAATGSSGLHVVMTNLEEEDGSTASSPGGEPGICCSKPVTQRITETKLFPGPGQSQNGGGAEEAISLLPRAMGTTKRVVADGGDDDHIDGDDGVEQGLENKKLETDDMKTSASDYEATHVHSIYSSIASHFSSTRHKPWPRVSSFLASLAAGSLGLDVGCGNGKYIGVNRDVWMVGSDACRELLSCAEDRLSLKGLELELELEATGDGRVGHLPSKRSRKTKPKTKQLYETGQGAPTSPGSSVSASAPAAKAKEVDGSVEHGSSNCNTVDNGTSGDPGGLSFLFSSKQNYDVVTESAASGAAASAVSAASGSLDGDTKTAVGRGGEATIQADSLALPFRAGSADFAICIAVLHHLSTRKRRVEGVRAILECLRPTRRVKAGQALLYVWALEQSGSRRGWGEGGEQDLLVPWVMKGKKGKKGEKARTGKEKKGKDGEGGVTASGKEWGNEGDATYRRYYHLYTKGELEEDVHAAGGVVVESGYERDNWWVVCEQGTSV